jgi:hypothetical protein
MTSVYFLPPVAFVVVLASVWVQSRAMGWFSLTPEGGAEAPGKRQPFASGQKVEDHRTQPDYSQFFHFAFFFTIMHVVALVVATVPRGSAGAAVLATAIILSAAISVAVLFRR